MSEIFHRIRSAGIEFTSEECGDYCHELRTDKRKPIVTRIGKYDWNDCDICKNPEVMSLVVKQGGYSAYHVILKWAECVKGVWAMAVDYAYGTGGGGSGVSFATKVSSKYPKGYPSELDAKVAACDLALAHLASATKRDKNVERLMQMVTDYRDQIKPKYIQLDLFADL